MIVNNRGLVSPHFAAVGLLLAVVGVWYMHRAYTSGSFNSDITAMVSDGKKAVGLEQDSPEAQAKILKAKEAVSSIFSKYKAPLPAGASNIIPRDAITPAPSQGVYYGQQ